MIARTAVVLTTLLVTLSFLMASNADETGTTQKADPQKPTQKADAKAKTRRPTIAGNSSFAPTSDEQRPAILVQYRAVQMELGLSDDEIQQIASAYDAGFHQSLPLMMQVKNTRDPAKRAAIQETLSKFTLDLDAGIKAKMKPAQARRITEISIQRQGFRALLLPEVIDALGLTPETTTLMNGFLTSFEQREQERTNGLRKRGLEESSAHYSGVWAEMAKKSARFKGWEAETNRTSLSDSAETQRQVLRLLTRRQQQQFRRMKGQEFDPEKHRKAYEAEIASSRDRPTGSATTGASQTSGVPR